MEEPFFRELVIYVEQAKYSNLEVVNLNVVQTNFGLIMHAYVFQMLLYIKETVGYVLLILSLMLLKLHVFVVLKLLFTFHHQISVLNVQLIHSLMELYVHVFLDIKWLVVNA